MQILKKWAISRWVPEYHEMMRKLRDMEYHADFFPRFVDPQVVEYQQQNELTTDGRITDVCVMFTDVRGFTKYSQEVSLPAANSFLNNFYDIAIHHTQRFGGVMDKFLGDGTMSVFGALDRKRTSYVTNCVAAAKAILKDFKDMTMQKDEPSLFLGVGLSQGPAMIGTFGNGEFVNFTAIGHTVNLAARVQGCVHNNSVYMTKEVSNFLEKGQYHSKGKFDLKNVNKKVELFELSA
ncbi:adenylate/guanylate cyclase domain-containing protein [Candidatus Dojkabacteria bacterium]|uniref:Adenylate/guanylate cyclase domain-containing protein n=1 Tax=Candidatus Dojkabacteria bacterium TaxID=2099670 RepID=A0A955I7C9_9BACT|nr:adenylate/guanylate cyclase domain-containing protein [Candidatus Dojkabacteria bacterium]